MRAFFFCVCDQFREPTVVFHATTRELYAAGPFSHLGEKVRMRGNASLKHRPAIGSTSSRPTAAANCYPLSLRERVRVRANIDIQSSDYDLTLDTSLTYDRFRP